MMNEQNMESALVAYPHICRVCLTDSGRLKNMGEWNLLDDFIKFADIQIDSDQSCKFICIDCEYNLTNCKKFSLQCQKADLLIKQSLKQVNQQNTGVCDVVQVEERRQEITISYEMSQNKLTFFITAEDMTSKINFPCPYECHETFLKKKYLLSHLGKRHSLSQPVDIEVKFLCWVPDCQYHVDNKNKFFTERKFLNQHFIKVHKSKEFFCSNCNFTSASESDLNRHVKTCNISFVCSLCKAQFKTNEALMVHLKRKHPDAHKQYKSEKKCLKEKSFLNTDLSIKDVSYEVVNKNVITCEISDNKLIFNVIVGDFNGTIALKCPFDNCGRSYTTRRNFIRHYSSHEGINESKLSIDVRYYCSNEECEFQINTNDKYFKDSQSVKHHCNEVHRTDFYCRICNFSFTKRFAYECHLKTCELANYCQICSRQYDNREIFEGHLLDKHRDLHKLITERSRKRNVDETVTSSKKSKFDIDKLDYICDSPKRSFATQTLDLEDNIRNDVQLPPWNPKTDEISTQTVFEDLLSLKSQNSEEDSIFFSETVSLSDIQTQTFPIEFGLSRSNKETITSETQSPDLSIKETQTCFCLFESPKLNIRNFESVSSSPSSTNLMSAETQTPDALSLKSDVFLGSNTAETQTSFEDQLGKETL